MFMNLVIVAPQMQPLQVVTLIRMVQTMADPRVMNAMLVTSVIFTPMKQVWLI